MAEEETADASEGIQDFLDKAKDAVGVDLAELLQGMMQANEEDAAFRRRMEEGHAEVMRRMDILIANQMKIYDVLEDIAQSQVVEDKEEKSESEVP